MENFDYDEIYRFINGEMPAGEAAAFEQRLQQDPALFAEVAFNRDLLKSIGLHCDRQLRDSIAQAHAGFREKGLLLQEHHIRQYLHDELPEELRDLFERRLAGDEDFAAEVDFQKDLLRGIDLAGDEALRQKIRDTRTRLDRPDLFSAPRTEGPVPHRSARLRSLFSARNLAIAASLLLLISAGIFLLRPSDPFRDVYASFYKTDEALLQQDLDDLSLIGMATPDKDRRNSLRNALERLRSGDKEGATSLLRSHLENFPDDEKARFYLGLSLMDTGQFGEAGIQFKALTSKSDSPIRDEALWYLGLCNLRISGKKAGAIAAFSTLASDTGSAFHQQANQILSQLPR